MQKRKIAALLCCTSIMLTGCSSKKAEDSVSTKEKVAQVFAKHVDAYTSASKTKTFLTIQEAADSFLGKKENGELAQLMSINPDGCPGISTIREWKYNQGADNTATITVQLTEGQTAQNLKEPGSRGTILFNDSDLYFVHVETTEVNVLEYSDEEYKTTEYDGEDEKAPQYNLTLNIISVEQSAALEMK